MVRKKQRGEAVRVAGDIASAGVSAAPIAGGPIAGLVQAWQNHTVRRALYLLERVVADHDIQIERLEEARNEPPLADLVEHGLRAAETAWAEEKLELLAGVVAAGLTAGASHAQIDRAHMLLGVIDDLEAVHIRALMTIGLPRSGRGQLEGLRGTGGLTNEDLAAALPEAREVLDPVLSRLEALGLIENQGPAARGAIGPEFMWAPTQFGSWLLSHLAQQPARDTP